MLIYYASSSTGDIPTNALFRLKTIVMYILHAGTLHCLLLSLKDLVKSALYRVAYFKHQGLSIYKKHKKQCSRVKRKVKRVFKQALKPIG